MRSIWQPPAFMELRNFIPATTTLRVARFRLFRCMRGAGGKYPLAIVSPEQDQKMLAFGSTRRIIKIVEPNVIAEVSNESERPTQPPENSEPDDGQSKG